MEAHGIRLRPQDHERSFDVGDLVVHPHHGVGRVVSNQPQRLDGRERSYLKLDLVDRALTIMVPCESATAIGLRAVIGPSEVRQIVAVLEAEPAPAPTNWSARERHYREKLRRRDVLELAAVVRDLGTRAHPDRLALRDSSSTTNSTATCRRARPRTRAHHRAGSRPHRSAHRAHDGPNRTRHPRSLNAPPPRAPAPPLEADHDRKRRPRYSPGLASPPRRRRCAPPPHPVSPCDRDSERGARDRPIGISRSAGRRRSELDPPARGYPAGPQVRPGGVAR